MVNKKLLVAGVVALVVGCFGACFHHKSESDWVSVGKPEDAASMRVLSKDTYTTDHYRNAFAINNTLKDPMSAQIIVYMVIEKKSNQLHETLSCVKVNSKNLLGAYTGFSDAIVVDHPDKSVDVSVRPDGMSNMCDVLVKENKLVKGE